MENFTITTEDVTDALNKLKDKFSRTPESIPPYFIKRLGPSIIPFLTSFFNYCLNYNFCPNQWKKSIVIPIFKKKNRSSPENYRPISLTSAFSRLLEIILHKKLLNYFLSNKLISENQFGFLPLRSTLSQLLKCFHNWISNSSQGNTTNIIYTDISKAFDTVNHRKLISVIKSYGVNSTIVNWLGNFLEDRYQQVLVNNILSEPALVTSGVPQRSIICTL